ncbi:MAG: L,D-transpeptidase, partial [Thermoleophilia bacterium]|nr:L,D-transpeptidase [Thermoleophilia bacterium]
RAGALGVGLVAAVVVALLGVASPWQSGGGETTATTGSRQGAHEGRGGLADDAAPAPVTPAFVPSKPKRLSGVEYRWAPVVRAVAARAAPGEGARGVAMLATTTPEGTANIVLTLGRATDAAGGLWVRVRLPILPAGSLGWVPRSALGGYESVRTHLVVDLDALRASLYRNSRRIFTADVGVGTAEAPTPTGEFYVRSKLERYRSPFYGPIAFGTSARSPVLTDWPAGGFVGIHGTNRPDLLPGRVSHGCIRMRNDDILRLAQLLPVGTPLTIRGSSA